MLLLISQSEHDSFSMLMRPRKQEKTVRSEHLKIKRCVFYRQTQLLFLSFFIAFHCFGPFWLTTFGPSMCRLGPITTLAPEAKLTEASVLINVKNKWICNLPSCPDGPVCLLTRTINVTSLAGSTIQTWKKYISKRNIQIWDELWMQYFNVCYYFHLCHRT